MLFCYQQLRRIRHLAQSVLTHLVDTHLGSTAKTVLRAAQHTIEIMLVTFELYHRVNDMFQDLRACQRSLLVNMSDQNHRHPTRLGKAQQSRGTFSHLRDAAGRRVYAFRGNGLHRIDHDDIRCHILNVLEDLLQRGLAKHQKRLWECGR